MSTAAIHCRRSTDQQGASLDDQEAEGRRYAQQTGLTVVHTYRESASGYRPGTPRPEFDRMMADAAAGEFDTLVVWRINRLSRQEGDDSALAVVWRLRKLGVQVHSIKEPGSGNDLADDLLRFVASYQGNAESRTKSADVQRGKWRGAQRGVYQGAYPPYGLRFLEKRPGPLGNRMIRYYEPDPETAPVVAELYRRFLAGESPIQIAVDFNRRGLKTPHANGQCPNVRSARRAAPLFHQSTLRNILRSPLSGGFAAYRDRRIKACPCASMEAPDNWADCPHDWVRSLNLPSLVDEEVWTSAQHELSSRSVRKFGGRGTGGASETFLLLGLLFCARCGERLACRKAHKPGRRDKYVCLGRKRLGCTMPTIYREPVDDALRRHFLMNHVVDTAETIRRRRDELLQQRSDEAALVRDEIAEVETELANTRSLTIKVRRDYEADELSARLYSELTDEYERRIAHGEDARDRLRTHLSTIEGAHITADIDDLLDRSGAAMQIIAGVLDADPTPLLNARLHKLFSHMTVSVDEGRVTVVPHLRDEGPLTAVLDFSDGTESQPPVDVVGEP